MTEPDESYHGTIYTEKYSFAPYIVKARMQLMRDFGCYPAANSSFLLNLGLETLPVRMKQYCENALTVAKFLESNDKVESVAYPGLESDKYHKLLKSISLLVQQALSRSLSRAEEIQRQSSWTA